MHFALQKNADAQRICLDMQAGLCLGICWQKIHAAIQSMPPPWDHKEDDWNPGPMSSYSPCTCRGKLKSDLMLFQRCLANACLTHLSSLMVPRNTLSPFRNHGPSRIPPIKFASNKVGIIFAITMRDWIPNLDRMSTPSSSLGAFNLLQHRHLTDLDCLYIHFFNKVGDKGPNCCKDLSGCFAFSGGAVKGPMSHQGWLKCRSHPQRIYKFLVPYLSTRQSSGQIETVKLIVSNTNCMNSMNSMKTQ